MNQNKAKQQRIQKQTPKGWLQDRRGLGGETQKARGSIANTIVISFPVTDDYYN